MEACFYYKINNQIKNYKKGTKVFLFHIPISDFISHNFEFISHNL